MGPNDEITPGRLLSLTQDERQDLIAELDQKIAELDHQKDVHAHGDVEEDG